MANKMTYKNALEMVLDIEVVVENKELYNKLSDLLESIDKKSGSKSKKEKEKQAENENIKTLLMVAMGDSEETAKAIKELQAENEELADYTNQKLSALIRQMVEDEFVVRIEEKRVAKFYAVK